jgi:hypothetical protein
MMEFVSCSAKQARTNIERAAGESRGTHLLVSNAHCPGPSNREGEIGDTYTAIAEFYFILSQG